MWAEARKQEKKLRGLMVDHKRRAERRREYYEKIRQDPTQFLQIHGQSAGINYELPSATHSLSSDIMMPWRGQKDNLIDRFDGRAHLDYISENLENTGEEENDEEMKLLNYERYRILIQNEFLKISERNFLDIINYEERYGYDMNPKFKEDKKKSEKFKAAIGYCYDDPLSVPVSSANESKTYSDDSDVDLDLAVDINALDNEAKSCLNKLGKMYNLGKSDFSTLLVQDIEESKAAFKEKQKEHEKVGILAKKSRKDRRIFRSKNNDFKAQQYPCYSLVAKVHENRRNSSSDRSRSCSPRNKDKIEFITSFGDDTDDECESPNLAKKLNSTTEKSVRSQLIKTNFMESDIHPKSYSRSKKKSRVESKRAVSKNRKENSDSDSSSSSGESSLPRYRSKYRVRRSSSSSEHSLTTEKPQKSPPRKSYYRKTLANESSDEEKKNLNYLESEDKEKEDSFLRNKASNFQENYKAKIQKKLQAQIKRQYKADKKAENERKKKMKEEKILRNEEIKDISSKQRQKERSHDKKRSSRDSKKDDSDRRDYGEYQKESFYYSNEISSHKFRDRKTSFSFDENSTSHRSNHEKSKKPKLVDY